MADLQGRGYHVQLPFERQRTPLAGDERVPEQARFGVLVAPAGGDQARRAGLSCHGRPLGSVARRHGLLRRLARPTSKPRSGWASARSWSTGPTPAGDALVSGGGAVSGARRDGRRWRAGGEAGRRRPLRPLTLPEEAAEIAGAMLMDLLGPFEVQGAGWTPPAGTPVAELPDAGASGAASARGAAPWARRPASSPSSSTPTRASRSTRRSSSRLCPRSSRAR